MMEPYHIRARYFEARNTFVSDAADWIQGRPSLEYRFMLLDNEDELPRWQGALEKSWVDEDGDEDSEILAFAEYDQESAFDADVARIRHNARQRAVRDNIDEFLAIIDIVKERAVNLGYEENVIEDWEGLFEDGPEDAYSLRDFDDGPRLHDHVERADECWYFHVAEVVDTDAQPLGWGLFVVHLPDLTSEAPRDAVRNVERARVLLIDHHKTKRDALLARRGFGTFMDNERMDDPEYAEMDDTEILENFAVETEWDDDAQRVIWQEYAGETLRNFLTGRTPYVYSRDKWNPRDKSLIDQFFEENPQPVWFEDQLRAALDDQAGVEPDEDDDSPWRDL